MAGLAVTGFICRVGYEVTKDVVHRLADGVDPDVVSTAAAAAGSVPGVIHAHAITRRGVERPAFGMASGSPGIAGLCRPAWPGRS